MAKGRGKGKGKDKGREKGKGRQIKISRWLGRSPSPEPTPAPESTAERSSRKYLKWIHAGTYEDLHSEARDIWYSFKQLKDGRYQIIYARDGEGALLGNRDVGQIKRNLITFDGHHSRKWRHFLNRSGAWAYCVAKKGRRCQRDSLLATFLDQSFVDPFPEGRANKAIGPRLNVIHYETNTDAAMARASSRRSRTVTPPGPDECYPHTNIPHSTQGIKVGAFKKRNPDAIPVIRDFLTGRMNAHASGQGNRAVLVDSIESAFYDQGWRVDRAAVEQALEDMLELGSTAFDSNAFIQNFPIRVDRFKGEEVEKFMMKVGGKDPTRGPDSDNSDDDSDDGLFVSQNPKNKRAKPAAKNPNELLDKQLARYMVGRKAAQSIRNSDDDEFEFLPDDSPLKGKGKALRKHAGEEGTSSQDNDHIEIDEERSAPAKRIKSEAPMLQSNWDNPIVIDADSMLENDSDIEVIEDLSCARVQMKQEPSDAIIALDTDDD